MNSRSKRGPTLTAVRPALLGLLISFAITMLLIALFSLLFVIVKSIAESAIVPLALISATAGCFVGAMICVMLTKNGGLIYGLAIGLAMFVAIWIIGAFSSDSLFGTETAIKLALLVAGGIAGGCVGRNRIGQRR